ncbi:MAG: response regulator [Albidovulum sp.]|uniref:glycosyltransferase family protein n=1 Tax=Albidovulum sp. TaxID=1872424 RepID=UPI003C931A18
MTRILLSEDEPVLARNIVRSLESCAMHVTHAASAKATETALNAGSFDLVLADISLGDGDGIEVISAAGGRLDQTPVVVMTGEDSLDNRGRAERIPVAAFLAKPFALSRLKELVTALTADKGGPGQRRGRGPSVVMYSHDTIGLGHMRRNASIARELVALVPGLSVLMLIGCPSGMIFDPHPGIDYVKLPSLAKLGRGAFQSGALRLDAATLRQMRSRIIEGVFEAFRPDLLLVDHEPGGVLDELLPVLERRPGRNRPRAILGLRDILDDPDRVRTAWAANGTANVIAGCYDQVLIYGNERFYPSDTAYGLASMLPGGVGYTGIVTTTARARIRPKGKPPRSVLVSGGGGRDAYPLIDAALSALATIPRRKRPTMTVVTGPLMDEELRIAASVRAAQLGVVCLDRVPDLGALLDDADLLITMTGYNSINEALAQGCPIITVPRLGPSAEQRIRAETLAARGLARHLCREALSAEALAHMMMAPPPEVRTGSLCFDGARRAAGVIADHLAQCQSLHVEEAAHAAFH